MNRIVECVPNFSEGRRPEVINAITTAAESARDVYVLDRHIDPDYNRMVLTMAGAPESMIHAILNAVAAAKNAIDLREQHGEHPRIGATDVVPFVPIHGMTMADCVTLAREAGRRIAEELQIPVYLYEAAATRPERVRLESIRLASPEDRGEPDFGPMFELGRLHSTAGAVVVGARKLLIAWNINLETADVRIARQIARRIRASSGGLPGLKAIGVFLESKNNAQVSMNVTDFEQTPLQLVFDTVSAAARQLGTRVTTSELVGLAPKAAFGPDLEHSVKALSIERFSASMVLENRLADIIPL
jgi:glutamate formiminotransferase